MNIIMSIINFILHIDTHLVQLLATYGVATYAIIFGIIFIETGLVLTPFLPGDSLLFAAGAMSAIGSFNIWIILPLIIIAAIAGDNSNYWIGRFFGEKMIANPKIPIKKEYIEKTQIFFEKYGKKTIILARFVPIVRTFTPFVAGVGKMNYRTFLPYDIAGGIAWVSIFMLAGFFFGNIPSIKHNFSIVIIAIILISVIPMVVEIVKHKLKK
jgi:membrane-associated protein